jgi:hypothetical protein
METALNHLKKQGTPQKLTKDARDWLLNFSNGDAGNC